MIDTMTSHLGRDLRPEQRPRCKPGSAAPSRRWFAGAARSMAGELVRVAYRYRFAADLGRYSGRLLSIAGGLCGPSLMLPKPPVLGLGALPPSAAVAEKETRCG